MPPAAARAGTTASSSSRGPGRRDRGTNPNDAQILASPVQRMFRGNSLLSSSVQWLRLSTDDGCNTGAPDLSYGEAATVPNGSTSRFFMDIGLKGGLAADAGEQPVLFNDGVGSSQMGSVGLRPEHLTGKRADDRRGERLQRLVPEASVRLGSASAPPRTTSSAATRRAIPGSPWNDGRWPPIRCIKTRPTGSMNQLEKGLKERLFGNQNANSCPVMPADATGFVKGRNYWDKDNNALALGGQTYGFQEGAHVTHFNENDPRIVTIFIAPTEAFAGNGQNTYPIAGFVEVYVTASDGSTVAASSPTTIRAPATTHRRISTRQAAVRAATPCGATSSSIGSRSREPRPAASSATSPPWTRASPRSSNRTRRPNDRGDADRAMRGGRSRQDSPAEVSPGLRRAARVPRWRLAQTSPVRFVTV